MKAKTIRIKWMGDICLEARQRLQKELGADKVKVTLTNARKVYAFAKDDFTLEHGDIVHAFYTVLPKKALVELEKMEETYCDSISLGIDNYNNLDGEGLRDQYWEEFVPVLIRFLNRTKWKGQYERWAR